MKINYLKEFNAIPITLYLIVEYKFVKGILADVTIFDIQFDQFQANDYLYEMQFWYCGEDEEHYFDEDKMIFTYRDNENERIYEYKVEKRVLK